jgi:hypothetical protein
LRVANSQALPHARLQEGLPVNKFHKTVAAIEAVTLLLTTTILLLTARSRSCATR